MFRSFQLPDFYPSPKRRRDHHGKRVRQRPLRAGLLVETLERRTMLSGQGYLSQAILDANAQDASLALLVEIDAGQQEATIQTISPVIRIADGTIVGSSTLMRTDNGITARLTATGLAPGAYTLWIRVDAPGQGPVSGFLAGHVVGQDGNLTFSAHVRTGQVLSGNPDLPSGPLVDPLHSTIRLVVRDHGPADPGRIYEQTHTFEPTNAVNFLISAHFPPA